MAEPPELSSTDLITLALDLLRAAERQRNSTCLRRALSTAYYAMFHSLARIAADRLVGHRDTAAGIAAWAHVYRALEHRHARQQCLNARAIAAYPVGVRRFANRFARLQQQRRRADYDPTVAFTEQEVRQSIRVAAEGVRSLERASEEDQRAFAAWVLRSLRRN